MRLLPNWLGSHSSGLALLCVETTIFANPPEVNADKEECCQRKDHAVQYIKPQQRIGIYQVSTQEQEMNLVSQ